MQLGRWLVFTVFFLSFPLLSGNLEDLEKKIREEISETNATFAIAFQDLSGTASLFMNQDEMMHAASTMKTPVMMRLFEMIDAGSLSLETGVGVKNSFHSIVDGSLFSLSEDESEVLFQYLGQSLTVERLITLMITKSSNMATNILIELADAKEVMRLMHQLNIRDIQVLRGVEDMKAYNLGQNNRSSAGAMLKVMVACARASHFTPETRERMLAILRQQHYNEMIPGGIPKSSGALVAHKTGSISTVEHDAAIVDLPNGDRYGLVIFVQNFKDRAEVQARARGISSHIYQYMISKK